MWFEKRNGKAMKSERPRKDLNASSAAGFWKLLDPSLQLPKANGKSGNSEADIRRRATSGCGNTREQSHRMKAQLGLGRVLLAGGCLY